MIRRRYPVRNKRRDAVAPVAIGATGNGVMVDDANVVQADIKADNGVIHVIDAVIMPAM